jgi:hypothetical protein
LRTAVEISGLRVTITGFKATLNKSARVEPVEKHSLQINKLQIATTGTQQTAFYGHIYQ